MAELQGFSDKLNETIGGVDFTIPPDELKQKIVDIASDLANESASGLIKSKEALLAEKSKKETLTASEKAKLLEMEQTISDYQLKEAETAEDYQKAKDLSEARYKKEVEEKDKELDSVLSQLKVLVVDNAISAKLVELDADKDLLPMAQASIASQATVVEGRAMMGDKTLEEYMNEWAQTPAGKSICKAPINLNGDASGGNNSPQNKALTLTEKAILANKGANL